MFRTSKIVAFAGGLLGTALMATPGQAGVILSPTSVVANSLGELAAGYVDENLINQSGLSSGFTSGVTDFDTYIGTAPTHVSPSGSGGYASPSNNVTAGTIDFDLGAEYQLARMVLWNDTDHQSIGSFTLFVSNDSAFSTSTNLGTFAPTTSLANPVQLEVFDIADGAGRYVRLGIHSTQRTFNNLVNFGELAFDVSAVTVPEPATLGLFGLGLAGLGIVSRRRKSA